MDDTQLHQRIDTIRGFNRFYTRQIGVLEEGMLKTPFSLTEARVLYEIASRQQSTATEIGEELGLDPGYLSRILQRFQKHWLIEKRQSETDGRQSLIRLTEQGRKMFTKLETSTRAQVESMLKGVPAAEQERLVEAMKTIQGLLGGSHTADRSYTLRTHRPGDIGWVIQRHGALYAEEYGWDARFEALVAEVAAKFLREFDPEHERCWIAERHGENVGSIFLVKESETVSKLRLLLVEPKARGLGIGRRLVEECLAFARQTGYRTMRLWTNDVLHAARHIYEETGFRLVHQEPHNDFGHGLMGQTWEIEL